MEIYQAEVCWSLSLTGLLTTVGKLGVPDFFILKENTDKISMSMMETIYTKFISV